MISLLCPSRGRPELVNRMITTALETAQSEVEIMIYLNFFKAKALDLCFDPKLILENICEGLQTYLFA